MQARQVGGKRKRFVLQSIANPSKDRIVADGQFRAPKSLWFGLPLAHPAGIQAVRWSAEKLRPEMANLSGAWSQVLELLIATLDQKAKSVSLTGVRRGISGC